METHIFVSYTAEECDQMEIGLAVLNDFTPINRPRIKIPIGESHDAETALRNALFDPPESPYLSPLVHWLASGISAAGIRRECASRMPPIHIATRLLAAEVKSKYGAMLSRLEQKKSDCLPEHGSKLSPPDTEVPGSPVTLAKRIKIFVVEEPIAKLQEKRQRRSKTGA